MVELFGVTTTDLEVCTELVPYAVCLYRCSLFRNLTVTSDGDVEALMGLISSFRNLGTV